MLVAEMGRHFINLLGGETYLLINMCSNVLNKNVPVNIINR
jgi:hypothetical protein